MNPETGTRRCKVAIIQQPPVFLNLERSLELALGHIEAAAKAGANLVVFPETWLPGYPVWFDHAPAAATWDSPGAKALFRILTANALQVPGPEFERLQEAAARTNTTVVIGANERVNRSLFNTMIFIPPSATDYRLHRKLMPTYTERLVWGMGDGSGLVTVDSPWGNIGGLICWEHWMPLARAAMHARNEAIHIAQWPAVKPLHQLASRHYAFEGGCFVLAAGTYLLKSGVIADLQRDAAHESAAIDMLAAMDCGDNDVLMNGGSAIIAPDSSYVAEPLFDKSAMLMSELDFDSSAEHGLVMDTDGHYSRPDIFTLTVDDQPRRNVHFGSPSRPAPDQRRS